MTLRAVCCARASKHSSPGAGRGKGRSVAFLQPWVASERPSRATGCWEVGPGNENESETLREVAGGGSIAAKKTSEAKHAGQQAGMRFDVDVFPTSGDDPREGSRCCEMLLPQLTAATPIGTLVP